jgi:hypothetical protein
LEEVQRLWDKLVRGGAPPRPDYEQWLEQFHVDRRRKKKKARTR